MTHTATLDCFGDLLEVTWDGNMWMSPANGQQHSSRREAMRTELEHYFRSCGDDPEQAKTIEQIEGLLENIEE